MKRRRWRARAALVVALGALAAYVALDLAASRWIERRLHVAIDESEAVTGRIGDVDACPACASYRVTGLDLDPGEGAERERLLHASAVEVGVLVHSLLGAQPRGEVVLRDAELQLPVVRVEQGDETALDVPWREIGRKLIPVPVDRVGVRRGVLVVRHEGYDEPIVWRFEEIEVDATGLARNGQRPASLRASGRTPGDGTFELTIDFADDASDHFELQGELRDVPLSALRTYIEQVMSIGVEEGSLGADFSIEGTRTGWRGTIDCRLDGLDVFDPEDLGEGPVDALWDAVAGGVLGVARLREKGPLEVRLEVRERLGEQHVDAWEVLARLLRRALLTPFVRPLEMLRAATLGDDDG